jgi:hypothetical protein
LLVLLAVSAVLWPRSGQAADCSPTTFVRAQTSLAGLAPMAVALGRFNADGFVDAAVADAGYPYLVSVLPGDGSGGFGTPISTPVGPYQPELLAVADFNGDGKLDLAVADVFTITILLGNGDGTFQASPVNFQAAIGPSALVVADFDGDGKLDLAEVSQNNGPVVFFGNGNGTFGPAVPVDATAPATQMAVGDVNGDGRADIAVSVVSSNSVRIYLGQANQTFQTAPELPVDTNVGPLAFGDFNGDGKLDLAANANFYAAILLGNGDGTFQAAVESPFGYAASSLTAVDIDLDGNLDLVATLGDEAGNVLLLRGNGTGVVTLDGGYQTAGYSTAAVVADVNGDGYPDIVDVDPSGNSISTLLSLGNGRFLGILSVPTLMGVGNFAPGDFNGDGLPDLATIGQTPSNNGAVQTLLGDGLGGFRAAAFTDAGYGANQIVAGDFDEDGKLDVAVTSFYADSVGFLKGNGDGTFQAPSFVPISNAGMTLAAADFNGDGHLDLVVAEGVFNSSGAIAILLGNGDGTFRNAIEQSLAALPTGLFVADFNGDGKLDVAISNQTLNPGQDTISIFFGNGDGTLMPPVSFPTGPQPQGLVGGDFNGDGKLDLIVADAGASNVSLLFGDGTGNFSAPTLIAVGATPVSVAAADFNADGKLDFATSNGTAYNASVLMGLGSGAFQSPAIYPTGPNATFILADDLIGSGSVDLAVANSGSSFASILLNSRLSAHVGSGSVVVGSPAQLVVSASGYGVLSYQWRKGGNPIPGATTATLTIDPVAFSDAGSYDVLVTDSCTTVASNPATLSVEFADVPTSNIFHNDIITIATAGITAGCGGSNYCPSSLVSRAQMAPFLLKSEHGSAYIPPPCTGLFADVPCPSPFANWIEQLAHENVTAGCGGGNYCPDSSITRAQMAVFLLKTKNGSAYVPPPATGIFGDVPVGSFAADFIEALYNAAITGGCSSSPLLYCPNNPVNRAQMAAFLVKTFF